MACAFEAENSLGPSVAPCRRPFDFTLTFEEVFFQLLPSSIFILAVAVRLVTLARCEPCVRLSLLYALKLGIASVFSILKLVLLIYTSIGHHGRTQISIPAASIGFLAAIALTVLCHFEHVRSSRQSYLLGLYLIITSFLTSATVRTYWLLGDGFKIVASISLAGLLVQIALLALESCSKRKWVINKKYEDGGVSAEESASFLSHSLFAWLNRLLLAGYRRQLAGTDLFGLMDKALSARESEDNFNRVKIMRTYGNSGYSLCLLSIRCLGLYAFAPLFPRLSMTAFNFSQPFLAASLIQYLNAEQPSKNNGYGLIGASFLVYTGIAVSTGWYTHLNFKCAAKIRAGLLDAISHKMLRSIPEKGSESKILTLMVNDVQRIAMNMPYIFDLLVVPIETGIGLWLLYRQVGPSSLTVLGLAIACLTVSLTIGKYSAKQQRVWLAATEARISATKHMLSSLKAIKMTGFDAKAASSIEKLRETEFAASKIFRKLLVGGVFTAYSTSTLAPVLVFGAYVGVTEAQQQGIDAAKLFGSLILISLVSSPLIYVLQYIPSLGAMLGCYGRLEMFLEKEDRSDMRKLRRDSTKKCPELSDTSTTSGEATPESDILSAADTSDGDPIISIRHGSFGWNDQTLLKDINLDISAGQHVVVTGPVGCGKSLLLQAILGELEPRSGVIVLHDTSVAYCGQVPWLENASARSNALRCAPAGDDDWHRKVIEACALREFLESQDSSKTIGSNGASISGGERQRLALARAVALRPRILVLDDVFSALDHLTKIHILERLFGPTGLLSEIGTTVIQVTQDVNCARFADQTFKIEDYALKPYNFPTVATSGTEESRKSAKSDDEAPSKGELNSRQAEVQDLLPSPALIRDRQVYQLYFNSIGRRNLAIFIGLTAAASFLVKFPDIWAQFWATDSMRPGGPLHSTQYWIGIYVALGILPLIFLSSWIGHLLLTIVPKSGVGLHSKLLNAVLRVTFVFISRIDTGDLINRFSQDLMLVDIKLPLDLANTAFYVFAIIINITLVAVAAIYVLAAVPVIILVLFVVQRFYLRTSKQLRQLDLQSKAGLQSKASEIYTGLSTIRAHGWQGVAVEEIRDKIDRTQEPHYLLWMVQTWLKLVLQLTVAGIAITVTGVAVATRKTTSGSAIGLAFLNLTNLGEALSLVISMWTSLETSLGAVARIESFEANTPSEKKVESPIDIPADWPQSREIVFQNVCATYDATSEKPRWSLEDISLRINAGEKVAVCGQSGSGKSTLLLSLLALVDTPRGTISVDGVDISRVPQSLLRSRFHVISQDTFVQNEGVRESLDPDGALSDDAINEVLEECAILDKVNAGGGLSARLGDDISFSVGEAQLFVLARTILQAGNRSGGVILFDEVTSSIDTKTEARIMKLMANKLRGKTIISVLHRLEVALLYDRILVLENGRVAQFGTPDEVIRESRLFSSFRDTRQCLNDGEC